jgi:hypothetical protein
MSADDTPTGHQSCHGTNALMMTTTACGLSFVDMLLRRFPTTADSSTMLGWDSGG